MILELRDICKTYIQGKMDVPVLKNISLSVSEGEYLAIMGPSGSGKTTLMNLIGCLDVPTSGEYYLEGREIGGESDKALSQIRLHSIGFVFQSFHLLPRQSALENVALPLLYADIKKSKRMELARAALEHVGLGDRVDFKPTQLSGGQCQRVAIARAIVNNPKILLADEPTGALDTKSGEQIMELFQKLNNEGVTVIMITHEPDIAAHARRVLHIRDGQLVNTDGSLLLPGEADPHPTHELTSPQQFRSDMEKPDEPMGVEDIYSGSVVSVNVDSIFGSSEAQDEGEDVIEIEDIPIEIDEEAAPVAEPEQVIEAAEEPVPAAEDTPADTEDTGELFDIENIVILGGDTDEIEIVKDEPIAEPVVVDAPVVEAPVGGNAAPAEEAPVEEVSIEDIPVLIEVEEAPAEKKPAKAKKTTKAKKTSKKKTAKAEETKAEEAPVTEEAPKAEEPVKEEIHISDDFFDTVDEKKSAEEIIAELDISRPEPVEEIARETYFDDEIASLLDQPPASFETGDKFMRDAGVKVPEIVNPDAPPLVPRTVKNGAAEQISFDIWAETDEDKEEPTGDEITFDEDYEDDEYEVEEGEAVEEELEDIEDEAPEAEPDAETEIVPEAEPAEENEDGFFLYDDTFDVAFDAIEVYRPEEGQFGAPKMTDIDISDAFGRPKTDDASREEGDR